MINEKPQYVIDAERRYNHRRNVVDYIDNNFNKYSSIVKYAKDNWGTMITTTMTDCPYFIADDVAKMINYQYQNK